MKRILFIGFNSKYINDHKANVLSIIGSLMDISFYGPGYSSKKDLELGINEWILTQKNFDYIIADGAIMLTHSGDKRKLSLEMNIIKFDRDLWNKYAYEYQVFFTKASQKKLLICNWDPYNLTQKSIERIEKTKAIFIDFFGICLSNKVDETKKIYGENSFNSNDNWYNFLNRNKHKTIVFPHIINSSEFDYTPLHLRKHKFSVVGAGYPERKEALKILPFSRKINHFTNYLKLYVINKLKLKMNIGRMVKYQTKYFNLISDTKLTYCSGSPLLYPVRKYFEIPAKGSVAIGWECNGFKNLGFIDRENFIIAKSNKEIKEVFSKFTEKELQRIANNGLKLIWDKHSDWARRKQFEEAINLINENKFKGSFWEKGNYKFN